MDLASLMRMSGMGGLPGMRAEAGPTLTFKAGMIDVQDGKATPDPRRGELRFRESPGKVTLEWHLRPVSGPKAEWSTTLNVNEATMLIKPEQKESRIIQLKNNRDASKHRYFWMQEVDASKDGEVLGKANAILTGRPYVAPPVQSPASGSSSTSSSTSTPSTSSTASTPATSTATTTTTPATPSTTAPSSSSSSSSSTTSSTTSTASSTTAIPSSGTTPAPGSSAPITGTGASGSVNENAFLRALQAMANRQPQQQQATLLLEEVLVTDRVAPHITDDMIERLAPHLPEGYTTVHKVKDILRSAQFQSAVSRFDSALNSEYHSVMGAMGMRPDGNKYGTAGFLDAIQKIADTERKADGASSSTTPATVPTSSSTSTSSTSNTTPTTGNTDKPGSSDDNTMNDNDAK